MNKYEEHIQEIAKAVIYCRVSSTKQKIEGSGLESQEHRCRQYAEANGYEVEAVFPDDASGGGDFMNRPGMVALLSYLDAQPGKGYVVIFDDLKRFARDTEFHIKLRREFQTRGARIECLNFRLDDSPEGKFVETIFAAQGELEREQNRRQVIQKMKARVEKGYWVFAPPAGYEYASDRIHGKLLMRDEPIASIIQEALEGYASGRFRSQAEVKRFLESKPAFPKNFPNGEIRAQKVTDLLTNPIYAGCVELPNWNVSLRKGQHEGLISFEEFERIRARRMQRPVTPARKDINADFPLRGFVMCDDCSQPMTACWSKGRSSRYPYYLCDTKGCESYRKSIPRAKIEDGFADLLQSIQPTQNLFKVARAMFIDAWNMRETEALRDQEVLRDKLTDLNRQIERLLDRILDATNPKLVSTYEARLEKLEREKLVLGEQIERAVPPKGRLEEFIEPALDFLARPWNIYENGSLLLKRTVLRLAFSEPLRYSRKSGYRTSKTTFPFKVLAGFNNQKSEMVPPHGLEPRTY
ncbi:recombinase family protein [Leisingera caerulea]|uniref:recombinase family protein n=1 Tax=Leisingera caerulea TaxID=506591 RepID=UPI0021A4A420|nr:recombinase family protein [Leisingera caerulea]UWQ51694.1 recombinase family protein [Leisingera caerulea]